MDITHMLLQFVRASESVVLSTIATGNETREATMRVPGQMALHLEGSIEQLVREADAALQDLCRLATWWYRVEIWADYDRGWTICGAMVQWDGVRPFIFIPGPVSKE